MTRLLVAAILILPAALTIGGINGVTAAGVALTLGHLTVTILNTAKDHTS